MRGTKTERGRHLPGLLVLASAALFGASTPLAKSLLKDLPPVAFAGLLYVGSGLGAGAILGLTRLLPRDARRGDRETSLRRGDLPWLFGGTVCGGVMAPVALMAGLRTTPAGTASLLLSFEVVATTLIAAVAFGELISRRVWIAVACVTLASALLSLRSEATWGVSAGALFVLAAGALWGLDTNLTRTISVRNPLSIVTVKGLAGGLITLAFARMFEGPLPPRVPSLAALAIGAVSYGVSMALFIAAMRDLRAARTAALFGTAPFIGAALSCLFLGEKPGPWFVTSGVLMLGGVALLLMEAGPAPRLDVRGDAKDGCAVALERK